MISGAYQFGFPAFVRWLVFSFLLFASTFNSAASNDCTATGILNKWNPVISQKGTLHLVLGFAASAALDAGEFVNFSF